MRFSQLHIGQKARIIALAKGQPAYRKRLIAMGLLPGAAFTVSRIAPLGDPIEIIIRGVALSLRKQEANILELEETS